MYLGIKIIKFPTFVYYYKYFIHYINKDIIDLSIQYLQSSNQFSDIYFFSLEKNLSLELEYYQKMFYISKQLNHNILDILYYLQFLHEIKKKFFIKNKKNEIFLLQNFVLYNFSLEYRKNKLKALLVKLI